MKNYTFKTTLENDETKAKIEKGGKVFEIQLLKDFAEEDFNIYEHFNNFDKEGIDVITVHAPLDKCFDNGTIYLETITCDFFKNLFLKTCKIAQLFADYYKHPIKVIIHNSFRLENYLMIPSLKNEIIKLMNEVIETYPDLYIQIENGVPLSIAYSEIPFFSAGTFYENIEVVNFLNENCTKPIFRTVFDVCHYLTAIRILKKVSDIDILLEDLFKAHENVIGTVHLANLKNLGFEDGEHGCGYTDNNEDILLLKQILSYIDKYAYNADICLEISEDNYFEIPNLLKTIELIKKIENKEI